VRRIGIVLAAAGIALVAAAGPAWAHVKVEPADAPQGSDAVLAFVVPNEMENATTTKVVVTFPTDHPITEALTEPIAGWTSEATTFTLTTPIVTDDGSFTTAVKNVTWTATGKGIEADNFQEFKVSVGLPDDADSLAFPTTQTYSNGKTVQWNQVAVEGGPEPDSPEPVLTLTPASADGGTTTPTTAPASGNAAGDNVKKSDVDNAKTVAIIAIVVGALGLVLGAAGIAMGRRKKA
jgi:uncharacterized protein YcnI